MTRRFYVDTSAYLCVLLGGAGYKGLRRELSGGQLLSSAVLVLETYRNLVRLSREGLLSVSEFQTCFRAQQRDMEQFQLRDLTLDLCAARSMPVLSTPRSLDLAHLRTALWFHEQDSLTRFVSLDEGLTAAAAEIGLPI